MIRHLAALILCAAPVFVGASAADELDNRQAPYVGLSGKELVGKLSNPEFRDRAYYELWRRTHRDSDDGFAAFQFDHNIEEIIECPQAGGAASLTMVLHGYAEFEGSPGSRYRIPFPRQIFPKANAEALQEPDPPEIALFTAEGQAIFPYGENDKLEGFAEEINRDGEVDRVRVLEEYGKSRKARILEITSLAEHPRRLLSVIIGTDDEKEWTYRLKDLDGDGVDEIEIGPRVGPGIKPKAVYRWEAGRGRYGGPKGKDGSHYRLLDPEKAPEELAVFLSTGRKFSKDPDAVIPSESDEMDLNYRDFSPPPPAKPYAKRKLEALSDSKLLERMGKGRTEWEYRELFSIPTRLPRGFWEMPPQEAALAMAQSNRTPAHKAKFLLGFDDRDGAAPPETGSVTATLSSSGCYNFRLRNLFLKADPKDSYLALGGTWSGGAEYYNYVFDQPAFDLRLCRLSYVEAKHILATLGWLDRLRTAGDGKNSARFSTGDGGSQIILRDGQGKVILDREGTLWYGELSEEWTGSFNHSAFTSFAAYLVETALPGRIGQPWRDAGPEEDQNASLRLDRPPRYSEAERRRLAALILEFLSLFSPSQDRLSYPIVAVAAEAAGALVVPEAIPLLEKITAALPAVPPPKRGFDQIWAAQEKIRNASEPGTPAQRLARNREIEELEAEEKAYWALAALDGPANLRAEADLALRKIAAANDPVRLLEWAKSLTPESQWAFQRLRELDTARYAEALEWHYAKTDPFIADQILDELRRIAPEKAKEIAGRLPAGQRAPFANHEPPQVTAAKSLPDPAARTTALLGIVTNIQSGADNVDAALDALVPPEAPLQNDDPALNQTLMDALAVKSREPVVLRSIASALARRDCTDAFDLILATLQRLNFSESFDTQAKLAPLFLLARSDPGKFHPKLEELLSAEFRKPALHADTLLWAAWAADLRNLKPQVEQLATSGPNDYENTAQAKGRYHLARKIADLWNNPDPVTTIRLLTGVALSETLPNSGDRFPPFAELQFQNQLHLAARALTPAQRKRLDEFFTVAEKPAENEERRVTTKRREIVDKIRKEITSESTSGRLSENPLTGTSARTSR